MVGKSSDFVEVFHATPRKEGARNSIMPDTSTAQAEQPKPKCKICCACPDTRKERDTCVVENGEEKCADKIEAHKACLRAEGFNV